MFSISTVQGGTTANVAYAPENGSQVMEQMETHFRFPEEFRVPEVYFQTCCELHGTGLDSGF